MFFFLHNSVKTNSASKAAYAVCCQMSLISQCIFLLVFGYSLNTIADNWFLLTSLSHTFNMEFDNGKLDVSEYAK